MNKLVLLLLLVISSLTGLTVSAQNSVEMKCKMTLEEVLSDQPWDIDHPTTEFANNIAVVLFAEINLIYAKVNKDEIDELEPHIIAIEDMIQSAKEINMNISMFFKDIDFVKSYKK